MEIKDYKSNSFKSRQQIEKEKPKPIAVGRISKKRFRLENILGAFFPESTGDLKEYIICDLLIPKIKDTVLETVKIFFYGKNGISEKKSGGKISYREYYRDRENRSVIKRERFSYEDIAFETRGEAEAVLEAMIENLHKYNVVTVGDLYDLADISVTEAGMYNYGWANLTGACTVRIGDNYLLKLPKAVPID